MDDLISRQAAISAIEHRLTEPAYQHTGEDWYVGMNCAESELYDLPSAQPERKKGKWNWIGFNIECSICGYMPQFDSTEPLYNYCPNCGADMREPS